MGIVAGAIGAVAVVGAALLWPPEEPTVATRPSRSTSPSVPPTEPPEVPADGERAAARDPWVEPAPEPLRPFQEMVESGHVFEDRREIGPLYSLSLAMPDDPRPLLLLGHLFVARAWYSDAIARYERAYQLDASVRGDPRMLDALVELAARDSVGERATEALERIYGPEALDAVETAVEVHAPEPLTQLRLVQLRDRLRIMSH